MIDNTEYEQKMTTDCLPVAPKYTRYRNVRKAVPSLEAPIKPDVEKTPPVHNHTSGTRSMGRYRRLRVFKADSPPDAPVPAELTHTDTSQETLNQNETSLAQEPTAQNVEDEMREECLLAGTEVEHETDIHYDNGYGSVDSFVSAADQVAKQEINGLKDSQPQLNTTPSTKLQSSTKGSGPVGPFTKKKDSKHPVHNSALSTRSKSSQDSKQSVLIEGGGGGIVPQIDAPRSAVNAGERRVLVRFKQSSISLPVTPDTNPVEIVNSAADALSQILTSSSSSTILLESFSQLGLERRIRKYEHIRDLMNSWDRDTQNSLIIEQTSDSCEMELEANFVPSEAPAGIKVNIYHSQKAGKWNKRYVTLLPSGQMFIAKYAGAKSTDKDYQNICHLSDFDIYTSMSQRVRKNHNSPGKIFYAIKSQQKTTMFLSSQNFVHYFSTDDDLVGKNFYTAVQRWRSWFLVNRKGDGVTNSCTIKTNLLGLGRSESQIVHSNTVSASEKLNQVKVLRPLVDPNQPKDETTNEVDRPDFDKDVDGPRHHISHKHPSPSETPADENREFLSSSLLGRSYSERKRELIEEILNRQRSATAPSTGISNDARALLNFTTSPTEPPQWSRTKGHGVRHIDGVPLIDIASNPNLPSPPFSAQSPQSNTLLDRKDSKMSHRSNKHKLNIVEGPFVEGGLITALITGSEAGNVGASVKYKSLATTLDKRFRN